MDQTDDSCHKYSDEESEAEAIEDHSGDADSKNGPEYFSAG